VLLHTDSQWKSVENLTPVAVPTGGGLAVTLDSAELVAGIEPYDRLTSSPLLTSADAGHHWSPVELPAGLVNSRGAVGLAGATVTAVTVTDGGTLVRRVRSGWSTITSARRLRPGSALNLDSITWANANVGWLTGHGPAGTDLAFTTSDGGRSWSPIAELGHSALAVLAPCGSGKSWEMPVANADQSVRVARTVDGGRSWTVGPPLRIDKGSPPWGCHGVEIWMLGEHAHLEVSSDAGASWADEGAAPNEISDLAPTSEGEGYATAMRASGAALYAVSSSGARFTQIELPSWVAQLAGNAGS
jgi:hypothetical protein